MTHEIRSEAALDDAHELFATLVASGEPLVEAAEKAGFARDTGRHLMHQPWMRVRVDELISEPAKARLRAQYSLAVRRTDAAVDASELGTAEWRANMTLHLAALDKLARFCGWIVDRKQVAKVAVSLRSLPRDISSMSPAAVDEALDALAPAQRAELRRLAAGELGAAGSESDNHAT